MDMTETKEISPFAEQQEQAMTLMREIAHVAVQKKALEKSDKAMRETLQRLCEEYGVESIDNDYVKISAVKGSESVTVDLKQLQSKEPDLYAELLEDYPKHTIRKPSLRIVAKE